MWDEIPFRAETLAEQRLAPHLRASDLEEPFLDGDHVRVLPAVREGVLAIAHAGLFGAAFDEGAGGLQMPYVAYIAALGFLMSGSIGVASFLLLTVANARLIVANGGPMLKTTFATPQIAGEALGTMCLSEPHAGSSLADIRTRALPDGEDDYGRRFRIFGHKIWPPASRRRTSFPGSNFRRPAAEPRFFQQVYYHRLGDDPARDAYVLGKDFPKVAEINLNNHQDPKRLLVTLANGDGGEFAHYVIGPDDRIRQLTHFADQVVAATIAADGPSTWSPIGTRRAADFWRGEPVVVTSTSLYVRELVSGPSRVAIFDHDGYPKGTLPLPDVASVEEVEALGNGSLLYSVETYLQPPTFADTEAVRDFAPSKDGTQVPVTIIRRKGTRTRLRRIIRRI